MKLSIFTNSNKIYMTLENIIIRNKTVYDGKLFSTPDDFVEHIYQVAIILSNGGAEMDKDIFDGSVSISTGRTKNPRYKNTFII